LTLAIYDITNTFFTVADNSATNCWPVNFQPNLDASPPGLPIFGTNVDFYLTSTYGANGPGQGSSDQLLVMNIAAPYQMTLYSNHNYAIELSADLVGSNSTAANLLSWIRSTNKASFEIELFPPVNCGAGQGSPISLPNNCYPVTPRGLSSSFNDPEDERKIIGGTSAPIWGRDLVMALYSVQPVGLVSAIQLSTNVVTYQRTNIVITWSSTPGATYSVLRTNVLKVSKANWPAIVTGYAASGSTLSYTDSIPAAIAATATNLNFYMIRSP
jgi:hypothetical protein